MASDNSPPPDSISNSNSPRDVRHPPSPPSTSPRDPGGREDDELGVEIDRWKSTARAGIVRIHGGTEDDVEIEGHRVGIGIDLNRYKRLRRNSSHGPEVVARAIAYLPQVTGLGPPVSLARLEKEDGPAVLHKCVSAMYRADPAQVHPDAIALAAGMSMPKPSEDEIEQARSAR